TVDGSSGTFALTFNGQSTNNLSFSSSAAQVQNALNALTTIGGVGGTVTVTQSGNVYTITFGGTLALFAQPLIIATGTGGATTNVNEVVEGAGSLYTVLFGGTFTGVDKPQLIANTVTGGTVVTTGTIMNGDGSALELLSGSAQSNGGLTSGLEIWNEHLIL